ncbi:hypothetical protein LJB96_03530 [Methanobrevibacter sp. OttesenSCG-928-K11]|nr:hypothetical protein [Methanobrevibacter sp. OttesenSCG-928-K11]MDL2270851.1 hypothetical protein [Methanobrevibacter sp. OttesenSCG-928-I08]
MIKIFNDSLEFKDKLIPETILGTAPLTGETYFGHRARLYQLDLHRNPENIAKIICSAYDEGVKGINLVNDDALLEGWKIAQENGCNMEIISTIGKREVDYLAPNYEKSKNVDWIGDIELFSSMGSELMLIDEFIVDGYDWDYIEKILKEINNRNILSGIITSFPFETINKLLDEEVNTDLFDFLMIPINKLAYMMDTPSFLEKERNELNILLQKLDKKIIASKVLAAGIQMPEEAFNFLKTLNHIDLVTIGVASEKEVKDDFNLLFNML